MSWRSLELGEARLPRLLAKTTYNKNAYEIQLTDLSRVWSERLEKRDLVARAREEGCSIDPSEDDQYDILLDKIDNALKGHLGTTLDLHSDEDANTLRLTLSAPLPGSLPTFVWTIKLQRRLDSVIGTELVTPLVSQALQLRSQMQYLIDELASKDRVIAKITDRLEASGNDLTAVFPGASGIKISRKKSQRGQLASHVKGLADFDENAWRKSINQGDDTINLSSDLLNKVLEHLPVAETPAEVGNWWTDLPRAGSKGQESHAGSTTSRLNQRSARIPTQRNVTATNGHPPLSTEQSRDEDEFQRQVTPPQLKKTNETAVDEDEETDDDDLDAVPSTAYSSQTRGQSQQHDEKAVPTSPAPTPRRLGVLGGKKSKSPQPELPQESQVEAEVETEDDEPPAPKPKAEGKLGAFGGKKAASPQPAHDPEAESEPVPHSPTRQNSKTKFGTFGGASKTIAVSVQSANSENDDTRSKHKLGTFGGKSRGMAAAAPVQAEADEDEAAPSPVKRKLGRMGGRGGIKSEDSRAAEMERKIEKQSRGTEEKEQQERREREDSQERADKKRERLKMELEEKAKGPAKKKRKF